jgi:hypothetical protein
MQADTIIPIEMLLFVQALVIAFIAAPDLTKQVMRIPFRRNAKPAPKPMTKGVA